MRQQRDSRGFTLPELMITLGVVAILMSTAVPGISSMMKDNALANQLNSVVAHLHYARAEAAKRDVRVILCRSATPDAPTPSCGGSAKVWEGGHLVFADDGNNTNSVYNPGTDILLLRGQPSTSGVKMRTNWTWNNNLVFNPDGSTNESGSTAIMALCDGRGSESGRTIQVAANGVPRMYAGNIATCYP